MAYAAPGLEVTFEYCPRKEDAKVSHQKLQAMVRGFKEFPLGIEHLVEAAANRRIKFKKVWNGKDRMVEISVKYFELPSETARKVMEEFIRTGQVVARKD